MRTTLSFLAARSRRAFLGAALALCTAAVTGCDEHQPGLAIAPGLGRNLLVGNLGRAAAFLTDAAHPDDRTVPEDLVLGDLWLWSYTAPPAPAMKVGTGVPSQAGAVAFRSDGDAVAFLASFRFRAGEGDLWVAAHGKAPRKLAEGVRSFSWEPHGGALAFISGQRLVVWMNPVDDAGPAFAASTTLDGRPAAKVHSFAWDPIRGQLAVRAPSQEGGALSLVAAGSGRAREVAAHCSDFVFSERGALAWLGPAGPKGGDRVVALLELPAVEPITMTHSTGHEAAIQALQEPREVGTATTFAFGPDGRELLFLSTESGTGDAFGTLSRVVLPTRRDLVRSFAPVVVAPKVSEWRFSSTGDLLLLSGYDVRSRSGTLQVAPAAGGPLREIGKRVQSFQLSPKGDRVLYTLQVPSRGDFKVELWTAELGVNEFTKAPRKLDEGVYGYQLSSDGAFLFYKARCGSGSRNCSLFRTRLAASEEPVLLATAVAGFDLAPVGNKLLIAHPHRGAPKAVDLAIQDAFAPPPEDPPKPFMLEVDPGSRFLDQDGSRVIAPLLTGKRATVRVVETPK